MAAEDSAAPISRPESRVSQSQDGDEDDTASEFHDMDEPSATSTPALQEPTQNDIDTTQHDTLDHTTTTVDPESSIAPHLVPSSTATAMSSQSSLNLVRDPSLQLDLPEASADELVAFLRGQITDLTSQVTSLNGKLVKSYTTRGDLEDNLHDIQEVEMQLKKRVKDLELDKERWTKEIEAGGWVERVSTKWLLTLRD